MPLLIQQLQDFIAEHGGPSVGLDRRTHLLSDGATYSHDGLQTFFKEPPANRVDKALLRLKYCRLRLAQVEKALLVFERAPVATSSMVVQASYYQWDEQQLGPAPETQGGMIDRDSALVRLRQLVDERRRAVEQATQDLLQVAPHLSTVSF